MNPEIYEAQLIEFVNANATQRPEFTEYYRHPVLNEDTELTGFDTHYIYHVAWAIKKIADAKPAEHVDISSSLNFCTTVCSLVPTTFIDYRPANIFMENLRCTSGNLTDNSHWIEDSYASLSCMHVVEHIGLGRYGDQLNVNADIVAMNNLIRALKKGGRLLFVVPVGEPGIYFNAHRIYSASWIANFFSKSCELKEFYLIQGPHDLQPVYNCDLAEADKFPYACGCFEFIKIDNSVAEKTTRRGKRKS